MSNSDATVADLERYGFSHFADVVWHAADRKMEVRIVNQAIADTEEGIYAFVIGGRVVRFGTNKVSIGRRAVWRGDIVTNFFRAESRGEEPGSTCAKKKEAYLWLKCFGDDGSNGQVYGRRGSTVETKIGKMNIYLDEERVLIERHKPIINPSPR